MPFTNDVESFLDEDFLRKLERFKIIAQKMVGGSFKGEHTSPGSGSGHEFLDYRKYQMGDDFRYIDWNVYGRLDKLFLKLFHVERDLSIHILLDMSGSMGAGEEPKEFFVKKIAAALSYIGLANFERVGLASFSDRLGDRKPPERGRQVYLAHLNFLRTLRPEGRTDINASLSQYASVCKRPGVAVILSDLMDPRGFKKGLEALAARKFDITLVQVLNHEELFPSQSGYLTLKEVETGQLKKISLDSSLLKIFRDKLEGLLEDTREFCLSAGIDYYLADTSIPFEDILFEYLTRGTRFQ